eukprot:10583627-Lingulodinium_polyedra.AAC.1
MENGSRRGRTTRPIQGPQRDVTLPPNFHDVCKTISQNTLVNIPKKYRTRYLRAWVETLEGMVVGEAKWITLARHRAKLILSSLGPKELHAQELGERLT